MNWDVVCLLFASKLRCTFNHNQQERLGLLCSSKDQWVWLKMGYIMAYILQMSIFSLGK